MNRTTRLRPLLACVAAGTFPACMSEVGLPPVTRVVQAAEPTDVSLIQLIANPTAHNGTRVRVEGFCNLQFEGNSIYLHKDDYDWMISKNALWLSVGYPPPPQFLGASGRYCLVEGTFSSSNTGHMGMRSGALEDISRLEASPSREELRAGARRRPGGSPPAGEQ